MTFFSKVPKINKYSLEMFNLRFYFSLKIFNISIERKFSSFDSLIIQRHQKSLKYLINTSIYKYDLLINFSKRYFEEIFMILVS